MEFFKMNSCGIAACVIIAGAATLLAGLNIGSFSLEIIGAPVFSIIFGMLISLIFPKFAVHGTFKDGIRFTSKKILQGRSGWRNSSSQWQCAPSDSAAGSP